MRMRAQIHATTLPFGSLLAERFGFRQALFEATLQFLVRLVRRWHGRGFGSRRQVGLTLGLRAAYAQLRRNLA